MKNKLANDDVTRHHKLAGLAASSRKTRAHQRVVIKNYKQKEYFDALLSNIH